MMTLITMTQGNPVALQRTIDSVKGICDEIVVGDLCMYNDDTYAISELKSDLFIRQVMMPFNFIYKNGFAKTLNTLSNYATNYLCLYLNVGEVVASSIAPVREVISDKYNCYYIDHATEKHRWWRAWDRRAIGWSGLIHEEIEGDNRPYHLPLFRFADTDKDTANPLKAKVMNDIKELVYFKQLMKIADDEQFLGATNRGWLSFAKDQYQSMEERLKEKGVRVDAFERGDKEQYLKDVETNPAFEKERFESSNLIEYQGDKKFLL
jgi:hypothetical protein